MNMDRNVMMQHHEELYMLHNYLARLHGEMRNVQMAIAKSNYKMYMHHMMHSNGAPDHQSHMLPGRYGDGHYGSGHEMYR